MTLEKWQKLSFFEQMGNIGSEIARAKLREEKKDSGGVKNSLWRAIELIDFTILACEKKSRRAELLRLREVITDLFIGGKIYNTPPKLLENYFLFFALAAQK